MVSFLHDIVCIACKLWSNSLAVTSWGHQYVKVSTWEEVDFIRILLLTYATILKWCLKYLWVSRSGSPQLCFSVCDYLAICFLTLGRREILVEGIWDGGKRVLEFQCTCTCEEQVESQADKVRKKRALPMLWRVWRWGLRSYPSRPGNYSAIRRGGDICAATLLWVEGVEAMQTIWRDGCPINWDRWCGLSSSCSLKGKGCG